VSRVDSWRVWRVLSYFRKKKTLSEKTLQLCVSTRVPCVCRKCTNVDELNRSFPSAIWESSSRSCTSGTNGFRRSSRFVKFAAWYYCKLWLIRLTSSRIFLTCAFQRSLGSSAMLRYLAVFEWGMTLSFIVFGICWHLLSVKSTCTNLASFSLIQHFLFQLFILSTVCCNFSVAYSTLSPTASMY
jgi:hypothetical protein